LTLFERNELQKSFGMKKLVSFIILFFLTISNAQEHHIVIELNNGTVKEGEINGWAGYLWGYDNIIYKSGGKRAKVPTVDVKAFTIYESGKIRNFEKIKAYKNAKNIKPDKRELFAEILYKGENIALFYGIYGMDSQWNDLRFYCLRKGEETASIVSFIFGNTKNLVFKKVGAKYFSDYPGLSKKIKNKEYTYKDIVEVVQEYDRWKSTK